MSIEKNIHLEVNKESVKGRWEKNNEQDAINIMVELYLKAIENKKIDRHIAKGADPEATQLMEVGLAKKLRELGQQNILINDKKLGDILDSQNGFEAVKSTSTH